MKSYIPPQQKHWTGRDSGLRHYLHEVVQCVALNETLAIAKNTTYGILGYACDEGVRRNYGRAGAADAPLVIRQQLAKMPTHLPDESTILDLGSIECLNGDMESAQSYLSENVKKLLGLKIFPVLIGGGHDIAFGHFNGIADYLGKDKSLGIINFDAHFDLRPNTSGNNSGTPFFQIAESCSDSNLQMNYMCLGIRDNANDRSLFERARKLGVKYIPAEHLTMHQKEEVNDALNSFMDKLDYVYLTIDMDGFSSAYAPGVSAASPIGFAPDIILESIRTIIRANKLISMDIAEMNPAYDNDNQTAKLAASLIHFAIHEHALS